MSRVALAVMAVLAWTVAERAGFATPPELEGKLWLVAMFPAVYLLGFWLLKE